MGAEGGLSFLQQACQQLDLPVALYTMSYHVTRFIWLLLQHVHAQHCAQSHPVRSSSGTGSISGISGSVDDMSQLIFSEDDDSDFGYTALYRHVVHL